MPILLAALQAGQSAANYAYEAVTDTGDFVYKNLETGFNENFSGKISGAKNNPSDSNLESQLSALGALFSAQGNSDINVKSDKGLYTDKTTSARYKGKDGKENIAGEAAVRSKQNTWSLLKYRGEGNSTDYNKAVLGDSRGTNNQYLNPTANVLIEKCNKSASYTYNYKDFVFAKWYGKIPNNYMLTLRRFPFPAEDNIINPMVYSAKEQSEIANIQPALAQAVTWMGESAGNNLNDILKFSVGFNWKQADANLQEINSKPRDKGFVGGFLDGLPKSQQIQGGLAGESAAQTKRRLAQGDNWDPLKQTYPNHTFAPLNVIKSMQVRESGLTFDQSFSIVFEYNLKGIPNTSPKVAFLDVLANLLLLTYNNAPFWGGGLRYTGGGKHIGKPFGNIGLLKKGDYKGFFGSIMKDIGKGFGNIMDDLSKMGDSKALNNVLGGGLMDLFGGPQGGQIAQAFLTGESTGQWHLTVGNPLNPIAVIGNLGCTKTDFQFDGPLGYEDFPTKLKVTVQLQPNRPRDKSDIESMFNAGKGRLYLPEKGVIDPTESFDVSAYGNKDNGQNAQAKAFFKKAAKYANG